MPRRPRSELSTVLSYLVTFALALVPAIALWNYAAVHPWTRYWVSIGILAPGVLALFIAMGRGRRLRPGAALLPLVALLIWGIGFAQTLPLGTTLTRFLSPGSASAYRDWVPAAIYDQAKSGETTQVSGSESENETRDMESTKQDTPRVEGSEAIGPEERFPTGEPGSLATSPITLSITHTREALTLPALFGLAMLTLSLPKARDQLGFTASASQSSQEPVATFTVEPSTEITSSQPVPSDDAPVEPSVESEVSEVAIAEVASAVAASSLPAQAAVVNEGSAANLAGSQLSRSNELKVQFAGIEGGGNHFVYLVDSSNSMRNFNEARAELLRSVDALQPDQRFYVVFYDQNPTHMRISAADEDDASSMLATPENKLVLRRWAMTIRQEKGKSPVETLRFAFGLEPDVIFLLSDGEFSAETEEVIRELNQRENLFGESQLATIIHTIRYPGYSPGEATKAEAQMRRIAGENGGQYRNIVLE